MAVKLNRYSIIVADDDEGDRFLINKAMKASGVEDQIHFVDDGQKLMDYLTEHLNSTPSGERPNLPCLILLDLNMPRLDGREALKLMKGNAQLKEIPVVILSNSDNPEDVMGCYKGGANSFFTKPLDYLDLVRLMGLLKTYWFQNAKLPFEYSKSLK
jgi:CheY-like chemotaxis protein